MRNVVLLHWKWQPQLHRAAHLLAENQQRGAQILETKCDRPLL